MGTSIALALAAENVDRRPAVTLPGEVRYAKSGKCSVAYRVVGSAPLDLVEVSGFLNHLETTAEEPGLIRFVEGLARFSRVLLFDKRGVGLSDRLPADVVPTLAERIDDVRAVMDAVGSSQAVILGIGDGGPVAAGFAATYPERTRALVLSGTTACGQQRAGYPWGPTAETAESWVQVLSERWGTGVMAGAFQGGDEVRQAFARMERRACTPRAAAALVRAALETDVRHNAVRDPRPDARGAPCRPSRVPGRWGALPRRAHRWRPLPRAFLRLLAPRGAVRPQGPRRRDRGVPHRQLAARRRRARAGRRALHRYRRLDAARGTARRSCLARRAGRPRPAGARRGRVVRWSRGEDDRRRRTRALRSRRAGRALRAGHRRGGRTARARGARRRPRRRVRGARRRPGRHDGARGCARDGARRGRRGPGHRHRPRPRDRQRPGVHRARATRAPRRAR